MRDIIRSIHVSWFVLLMVVTFHGANICARAQGTTVPPEALPDNLKDLVIKEGYVPSSFKRAGVIHGLTGNVVVIHRATNEDYLGKEGDFIHENDSLNTLAESHGFQRQYQWKRSHRCDL